MRTSEHTLIMKKSLFLLLLLSCCASSFATHVCSAEWAVVSDSLPPVVGVLSVGTSLGEGRVDVAPGTMWTLPGALFIGGSGNYSGAPNTGGHDGIFTMGTGSSLLAGGSDMTANGAQSHINVGNSRFPITGTLELTGARLQAEQLVVGYNAGTGMVRVSDGGHLVLTNDKAELGRPEYNGLLIGANAEGRQNTGSGLVQLEGGSVLESVDVFTSVGTQGRGQLLLDSGATARLGDVYVGERSGGDGLIAVRNGALLETAGSVLLSASGALEMENGRAGIGKLYVDGGRATVDGGTLRAESIALNEVASPAAQLLLSGNAVAETRELLLGRGATLELADSACCLVTQSMKLLPGATLRLHVGEGASLTLADGASCVAGGTVVLTMDDRLLPSLMDAGAELCVVSSSHPLKGAPKVYWNRNGKLQDITAAICPEDTGLVLRPELMQGLQTSLADALLQPAASAAVNTLNGTLAASRAFLRTLRAQNAAPQMARDGRLLHADAANGRLWAAGMGAWERVGSDAVSQGYRYSGGGYAVGGEMACAPHLCVGAALGQMLGRYRAPRGLMHDSQSLWEAGLNLRYTRAVRQGRDVFRAEFCGEGGLARNRARGAFFAGGDAATGRWTDKVFGGAVQLSYDIGLTEHMSLTPSVGIEAHAAQQGHVAMSDGERALHYSRGRASLWTLPLGLSWQTSLPVAKSQYLVPRLSVAYLRDLERRAPRAFTAWAGGSGRARGTKPGRDGVEAEAGVLWMVNPAWSLGTAFAVEYRADELIRRVRASADYSF